MINRIRSLHQSDILRNIFHKKMRFYEHMHCTCNVSGRAIAKQLDRWPILPENTFENNDLKIDDLEIRSTIR